MSRPARYHDEPGYLMSPTEQAPNCIVTSLKVAYHYGKTLPTVAQLCVDFGMHRATAYRWRRAIKNALGLQ